MMNDKQLASQIRSIMADAMLQGILPFTPTDKIMDMLRASGRLAPAVEGDVVEQAKLLIWGNEVDSPYIAFNKAVALIAAATEARHKDQLLGILAEVDFAVADHTDGSATMKTNAVRLGIIRDSIKFALKGPTR